MKYRDKMVKRTWQSETEFLLPYQLVQVHLRTPLRNPDSLDASTAILQCSDYNLIGSCDPINISTNNLHNRAHINCMSHQPNASKNKKSMKLAIINCRNVVNKKSELNAYLIYRT